MRNDCRRNPLGSHCHDLACVTPASGVRRVFVVGACLVAAAATATCDPCAGTPSCDGEPVASLSGQFIEHPSGTPVGNVRVAFARSGGAGTVADTVVTTADADGFFSLRIGAWQEGEVEGALIVTPPAPRAPYSVPGLRIPTSRRQGDGRFLGRLMVNPYLQFVAEVRQKWTLTPIKSASVKIRRVGGALVQPDSAQLTSSETGLIEWTPSVVTFGNLYVDIEIAASGQPRTYRWRDTLALQYLDEPVRAVALFAGGGSYVGVVRRRGTLEQLPGVTVEFVRTGGAQGNPQSFTLAPDANGYFDFGIEMPDSGTLVGDLTIRPPAPFPVEVRTVSLTRFDRAEARLLGPFGYGAAAIARPVLIHRATGRPVPEGTWVRFTHVGGIQDITPLKWNLPVDSGIRVVDSTGTVGYDAATPDSGVVLYDMEVRFHDPNGWETILAKPVPARYSDVDAVDTVRVGTWLPWRGEVRDAATDAPVNGAKVTFIRTGGSNVSPRIFAVTSDADGIFPLSPTPLGVDPVIAALKVRAGPVYRDTIVTVQLSPVRADVPLSTIAIRLTRAGP